MKTDPKPKLAKQFEKTARKIALAIEKNNRQRWAMYDKVRMTMLLEHLKELIKEASELEVNLQRGTHGNKVESEKTGRG